MHNNTRGNSSNLNLHSKLAEKGTWEVMPHIDSVTKRLTREILLDADTLDQYSDLITNMHGILQKYEAAMREMVVRFEILDRDLSMRRNRNPIHHIESRIKTPASIYDKLIRYGKEPTVDNLEKYLMDVAGVRVICSYVSDVSDLVGLLEKQDDLEIVRIKDYLQSPKPNGYRSLHAIVRVPVYFMDNKEMIPVEVQIRTIAMDYWASLEHHLKYKAADNVASPEIVDDLKECAQIIEDLELRMQKMYDAFEVQNTDSA